MRQQVEALATPRLVMQEEQCRQRELERRLLIAERDERGRLKWVSRFPGDVTAEKKHFADHMVAQKAAKKENHLVWRADKAARRAFIEAQMVGLNV
jgi:hypothetical protein